MKKIVAMMMVIILTLSLGVMAQAEVKLVRHGWRSIDDEQRPYVVLESQSGDSVTLYVTQEEQDKYVEEWFLKKAAKEKAEEPSWFKKMVDWIVFWN